MGFIKKALFKKLFLELLKSKAQRALTVRNHFIAIKLIDAVALKNGNSAADNDSHSVFRPETHPFGRRAEHNGFDCRRAVLECEIKMT